MGKKATKKRAVIIFGAGASVEFGIPSTSDLTKLIEKDIFEDELLKIRSGDEIYKAIKTELSNYLSSPSSVNFENIYHCAHELFHLAPESVGGTDRFKPLLVPFMQNITGMDRKGLRRLERGMLASIYSNISRSCEAPTYPLSSLRDFLTTMSEKYTTRIYSTNYDDLPLQAVGNNIQYHTGFIPFIDGLSKFDSKYFWGNWNVDALFHLHGSVRISYLKESLNAYSELAEEGELFLFDDRTKALELSGAWVRGNRRMDGGGLELSPIITGLDKLSRIQQSPFCYYYASLGRDLIEADAIFIIGSGLGDLHINTWLHESRKQEPKPSLIFVDNFENGYKGEPISSRKSIEMSLSLLIKPYDETASDHDIDVGWTISKKGRTAVWEKGFKEFLHNQDSLWQIIKSI